MKEQESPTKGTNRPVETGNPSEIETSAEKEIELLVRESLHEPEPVVEDLMGVSERDFERMANAFGISEKELIEIFETSMD